MPLSREEANHLAALCRIAHSEDDLDNIRYQLSNILEQFEVLTGVDTEGVKPTAHSVSLESVMREDEPTDSHDKESTLSNAPKRESDCFKVNPVLEE